MVYGDLFRKETTEGDQESICGGMRGGREVQRREYSSSRGSSQSRAWTSVTSAGGFFTTGIPYLGSPCKGAIILQLRIERGFPGGSDGKESAWIAGDPGSISGLGRCPGKGHGNPLQYSCLVNPMDRGAWQATVHGVAKSQTWLNDQHLKKNLVVNNTQWMDIYY